jgi:Ca2+-binding RTX toxin-like protein
VLQGGAGNDLLTGGFGEDEFVFNTALNATTNVDQISDFVSADDRITLSKAIFAALGPTGIDLDPSAFRSGAGAVAGADADDRIIYNTSTGDLFYDANGSAAGGVTKFATLIGAPAVFAHDIFVTT